MKEIKPANEYTQEDMDKMRLATLIYAANSLGVSVTELVIRDGESEWSTPDGKTVICEKLV